MTNTNKANLRDLIAAKGLVYSNEIQIDFAALVSMRNNAETSSMLLKAINIIS